MGRQPSQGLGHAGRAQASIVAGPSAACDRGNGVVRWTTIEEGLGSSQFYTGAVSATGQVWLGGTQDNGTLLQSTFSAGNTFSEIFGGDGASVAIKGSIDEVNFEVLSDPTGTGLNFTAAKIEAITELVGQLEDPATDLVRRDANFKKLGLTDADVATDAQVIDVLSEHPQLLQRPVLVKGGSAIIGRPKDRVEPFLKG